MSQGDLLTWTQRVECRREPSDRPTIEQRFAAFHHANPHVFEEMLRLARERLDAGATRIGTKSLYEQCRESLRVKKIGTYALNNDYTAPLARLLIEAEPRLDGVIELRRRKAR